MYTPETSWMKRTSFYFKNMWIKQLCNRKVWDFVKAFRARKYCGNVEKGPQILAQWPGHYTTHKAIPSPMFNRRGWKYKLSSCRETCLFPSFLFFLFFFFLFLQIRECQGIQKWNSQVAQRDPRAARCHFSQVEFQIGVRSSRLGRRLGE